MSEFTEEFEEDFDEDFGIFYEEDLEDIDEDFEPTEDIRRMRDKDDLLSYGQTPDHGDTPELDEIGQAAIAAQLAEIYKAYPDKSIKFGNTGDKIHFPAAIPNL